MSTHELPSVCEVDVWQKFDKAAAGMAQISLCSSENAAGQVLPERFGRDERVEMATENQADVLLHRREKGIERNTREKDTEARVWHHQKVASRT